MSSGERYFTIIGNFLKKKLPRRIEKKEKGLMNMDNSVVIAEGRGINGNVKQKTENKRKNK